ncbi:hypothetical protein PSACC_02197 [Paramicrosporidium saccamoebae]|uniref:Mitochondrial import inner membrane translocase subunit n=1 Tax=Paramicrosporidium saccamoebae TaxID=1246581 RepID=A0A2H9TJH3_9FUNG|nr:hypothetical protein PSACC_02197 [Paramicrosporidium saccamoebae]
MVWFFGGGGHEEAPSAAVVQLEQQIEMMDMVFMRAVKQCGAKCIPPVYRDGELNKGESVCSQRCLNKFFDVLEVVSSQLAEVGMQAQQAGPPL